MYFRRYLEDALTGRVSRGKVRLLFGARQTGKTALLRAALLGESTRLFDLQSNAERRRFEVDPSAFSREVRALPRTVRNVIVDEIQKVPNLLDEVQELYGSAPKRWQFYLTGSSARRLKSKAENLLPGRAHVHRLYPVCLWETARGEAAEDAAIPHPTRTAPHDAATAEPTFPAQDLRRLLVFGSLPGIRAEAPATARATLSAYADAYLEEEIRREALVRDLGAFAVFLRLVAAESGQQINLAHLSQQSGVAASTLKTYYDVLEQTFVGYWLRPYARGTRRRLLTTPRFYLFDLGVRNLAAEVPLDTGLLAAQGGPLLEHWVALELIARAGYLGRLHRVSFWRTATGAEVDFVWEGPRWDIPVEVKWTESPRPADARHVETFLDEYPQRARQGLVVCRCPRPQQLTERVRAIPWQML